MDYGSSDVHTTLPGTSFVPHLCSSGRPSAEHPHLHMSKVMPSFSPLGSWVTTGLSYFIPSDLHTWLSVLVPFYSMKDLSTGWQRLLQLESLFIWIVTTGRHSNAQCLSGVTLSSRRSITYLAASCVLPKYLPEHRVSSPVFLLGSGWSSWIRITLGYFNRESFVNVWHLRGILGEGISLGCKLWLWYHFLPSCCKDRRLSLFLFPFRFFSMNSLFLKLSQRSLF